MLTNRLILLYPKVLNSGVKDLLANGLDVHTVTPHMQVHKESVLAGQ